MEIYTEHFIHQVLLSDADIGKIIDLNPNDFGLESVYDWCDQTFGENMWYSTFHEASDKEIFAFKDESHRDWFILRWS